MGENVSYESARDEVDVFCKTYAGPFTLNLERQARDLEGKQDDFCIVCLKEVSAKQLWPPNVAGEIHYCPRKFCSSCFSAENFNKRQSPKDQLSHSQYDRYYGILAQQCPLCCKRSWDILSPLLGVENPDWHGKPLDNKRELQQIRHKLWITDCDGRSSWRKRLLAFPDKMTLESDRELLKAIDQLHPTKFLIANRFTPIPPRGRQSGELDSAMRFEPDIGFDMVCDWLQEFHSEQAEPQPSDDVQVWSIAFARAAGAASPQLGTNAEDALPHLDFRVSSPALDCISITSSRPEQDDACGSSQAPPASQEDGRLDIESGEEDIPYREVSPLLGQPNGPSLMTATQSSQGDTFIGNVTSTILSERNPNSKSKTRLKRPSTKDPQQPVNTVYTRHNNTYDPPSSDDESPSRSRARCVHATAGSNQKPSGNLPTKSTSKHIPQKRVSSKRSIAKVSIGGQIDARTPNTDAISINHGSTASQHIVDTLPDEAVGSIIEKIRQYHAEAIAWKKAADIAQHDLKAQRARYDRLRRQSEKWFAKLKKLNGKTDESDKVQAANDDQLRILTGRLNRQTKELAEAEEDRNRHKAYAESLSAETDRLRCLNEEMTEENASQQMLIEQMRLENVQVVDQISSLREAQASLELDYESQILKLEKAATSRILLHDNIEDLNAEIKSLEQENGSLILAAKNRDCLLEMLSQEVNSLMMHKEKLEGYVKKQETEFKIFREHSASAMSELIWTKDPHGAGHLDVGLVCGVHLSAAQAMHLLRYQELHDLSKTDDTRLPDCPAGLKRSNDFSDSFGETGRDREGGLKKLRA